MNHRHRHDVEDTPDVHVLWIGKLLVATAFVVCCLDVLIDLAAIRAFEINVVVLVRVDSSADVQARQLGHNYVGTEPLALAIAG